MGHGFGGTTAIFAASKDKRIKKVVTFDPWLHPLKEEIENQSISVPQPHCSISSEMFTNNLEHNWQLLDTLFRKARLRGQHQDDGSILCLLKGVGHMAFSDLSLILLLELRLI